MQIPKGLAGTIVDETSVSFLDVDNAKIYYRGYALDELLRSDLDFEAVAYLLLKGKLPIDSTVTDFFWKIEQTNRDLPSSWRSFLTHKELLEQPPMKLLSAVISIDSSANFSPTSEEQRFESEVLRLWGKIPTLLASSFRLKNSMLEVTPDKNLKQSDNLFKMFFNERPSTSLLRAFDQTRIVYAEHEFNAATYTARVVTSTQSDFGSAVVAAINALKGEIHGGAIEEIMKMLLEIESPQNVGPWLNAKIQGGERIPGFGHRLYKNQPDPRFAMMFNVLELASTELKNDRWLNIVKQLIQLVSEKKSIFPNLDLASAPFYYLLGFPVEYHTALITMSRYVGWCAHIREQALNNRIIRPSARYTGTFSVL